MARRGRPKKAKARWRTPPNQRPAPDDIGPTPEALAKKAMLLGLEPASDLRSRKIIGGSFAMKQDGSSPLAAMYARGLLDIKGYKASELRSAGEWYQSLYWRDYGAPVPGIGSYGQRVGRGSVPALSLELLKEIGGFDDETKRLQAMMDARDAESKRLRRSLIKELGWQDYNAFANVICAEKWPDDAHIAVRGLKILVDAMKRGNAVSKKCA